VTPAMSSRRGGRPGHRRYIAKAMYAVVSTGGKQYRVEEGQRLEVERLGEPGTEVQLRPVLLVDGDTVSATPDELAGVSVLARVLDEHRGPKIQGFTYKPKSNQRRRYGHRQTLATIEITGIRRS
jgi:large subunit ribosomal protein L21